MLDIPEKAVTCFEKWSRTRVVIYDWSGEFHLAMRRQCSIHAEPFCAAAKQRFGDAVCVAFDVRRLRDAALKYREGGVKICRSGILEYFHPLWFEETPVGMLCAGCRSGQSAVPDDLPVLREPACAAPPPELAGASPEELTQTLEGLRQLASRLENWYALLKREARSGAALPRPMRVHAVISAHCGEKFTLADAAKIFHLSSSRTAHMIREVTGRGFKELLNGRRLFLAARMLRTTSKSVAEIARMSGFNDPAYFHRCFKRNYGMTPHVWRTSFRA